MMLNRVTILISFLFFGVLCGCYHMEEKDKELTVLFHETAFDPDTVLLALESLKQRGYKTQHNIAYFNLLYTRAYEEKYMELPSDSIDVYGTSGYFIDKGNPQEQAYAYFYLGRLHATSGKENDALNHYLKALELAEEEEAFALAGRICRYMGEIYWKDKEYHHYIEIMKRSTRFFSRAGDVEEQILAYRNIARGFLYGESSDSALVYCKEGEILARKINDPDGFLEIYNEIGNTYLARKEYDLAEIYLKKALEATTKPSMRRKQKQMLTSVLIGEGKYAEAKSLLTPLLTNEEIPLTGKANNCLRMSDIENGLKNYKEALAWYKEYKYYSDSIATQRENIDTEKVRTSNEIEKLTEKSEQLKKLNRSGMLLLIIFILIALYCLYKSNKLHKKNKSLRKKNENLRKELKELHGKLLEKSSFVQKASLLLITPSHKRTELEMKMKKIFASPQLTKEDWEELEELINKTQNGCAKRMRKKYTNLTEEEIRTLILISQGIDNNKLAMLFNIRIESIMTKRYRIRKKIGVPKEIGLEEFISQ